MEGDEFSPAKSMAAKTELLTGANDDYGGLIVHIDRYMDSATFISSLTCSIEQWKRQDKKGVWLKLPIQQVNLVEPAVRLGFWYHHAESDYVMLVYWIPKSAHTIPANATHRLGIAAFLINPNREVLVVQEKGGQYKGKGLWKLPTGAVDQEEDIYAAAIREVKEETGIDSEFVQVLAFRETHKSFFEKSDLLFLCLLRPLTFDIQKQDQEIEAAKWMPFEEYAVQPFVQKYELLKYLHDICKASTDGNYTGFSSIPTSSYSAHKSYLYLNSTMAPKSNSKL